MHSCFRRFLTVLFLLATLCFTTNIYAVGSGAFRVELSDAAALGKGTAFVGEANTPAATYYNPAGLNQVKGVQAAVGFAIVGPQADYKSSSGDTAQMRRQNFFIPNMYVSIPVVDKLTVGIGANSYFGLATHWAEDSNLRYVATESEIENKNYTLAAAYQVTDNWSVGLSSDYDDSKISLSKRLIQPGGADGDFQLKGKDGAFGYRIASLFKINEANQWGIMYRSRFTHNYEGKAYLDQLNNSGSAYQTIFGGPSYETKVTSKMTLPQSVVIGYSFKPIERLRVNLDLEWMDWSSIKNQAVNFTQETDATRLSVLNSGNPTSKDWKSVWSQSIGLEYAATDTLRLRGGYYHHDSPIPNDTFDPSLPDSDSHGITTGFGYDLTKNITIDMAYSLLIYHPRKVDNDNGSASGATIDGKYTQIINMYLMSLLYKF
jgi:long-chain fatty acid transport protein